jgi:predicted ArsR family transcriptional regulator
MNQVARNTDSATSWSAAYSAKTLAAQHATIIIAALCKYGAMGKDGIATITGLDGNQVARRLSELERNHEILLTGRNVQSKAGRAEREWKVMPQQMELI